MTDRFFLDTNVLVYANDRSSPVKRALAREIVDEAFRSRRGVVSTQVLQEFFVTETRKAGVPWETARSLVRRLTALDCVVVSPELVLGAIDLHRIHQLSFWDALIVRAAVAAGCRRLVTEDLNHGQVIEGVWVVNPFV